MSARKNNRPTKPVTPSIPSTAPIVAGSTPEDLELEIKSALEDAGIEVTEKAVDSVIDYMTTKDLFDGIPVGEVVDMMLKEAQEANAKTKPMDYKGKTSKGYRAVSGQVTSQQLFELAQGIVDGYMEGLEEIIPDILQLRIQQMSMKGHLTRQVRAAIKADPSLGDAILDLKGEIEAFQAQESADIEEQMGEDDSISFVGASLRSIAGVFQFLPAASTESGKKHLLEASKR